MRRWLWLNGLALVSFGAFAIFLVGQSLVGWHAYNGDLQHLGMPALSFLAYLGSGHFVEATTENWESEFLQMGAYVVLTAMLVQRGSPESNPPDQPNDDDPSDPKQIKADSPPPVHRGGLALKLYENSLSITLFGLFALSFVLHLLGGTAEENVERRAEGEPETSPGQFIRTSQFWFQSLQNWQSEFLAVGLLIVGTIFLRQRGSAQSKKVAEPHTSSGK
ncbi:MAG TPA: DUF6766 family protein [Actinomycetes bacterium]|jgi:hypothetical protein